MPQKLGNVWTQVACPTSIPFFSADPLGCPFLSLWATTGAVLRYPARPSAFLIDTGILLMSSLRGEESICQSQTVTYFLPKDSRQIGEVFSCRVQATCRCCGRCQPCALTCAVPDGNKDLCFSHWMPPFVSVYYPGNLNTRSYVGHM